MSGVNDDEIEQQLPMYCPY